MPTKSFINQLVKVKECGVGGKNCRFQGIKG
jgi:hypothetical protein